MLTSESLLLLSLTMMSIGVLIILLTFVFCCGCSRNWATEYTYLNISWNQSRNTASTEIRRGKRGPDVMNSEQFVACMNTTKLEKEIPEENRPHSFMLINKKKSLKCTYQQSISILSISTITININTSIIISKEVWIYKFTYKV